MCGIVGIISKQPNLLKSIEKATCSLAKRGPDFQDTMLFDGLALGHARLSIIDTTDAANQPFTDKSNRYTLIFNGEIYNYKELKDELIQKGFIFSTQSDTEVLLNLYIEYGKSCLEKLNGFFAFAVYDTQEKSLFIARDRLGIKPLLYYFDEETFVFASELKAICTFDIEKKIDKVSLFNYLQFNYIPSNNSMMLNIKKLTPGNFIYIEDITDVKKITETAYYCIPYTDKETLLKTASNYEKSKTMLYTLMHESVEKRLVADVPVGTFLSGGVDSSIISLIAKKHKPDLNTFSIGFKDEPFFDETTYAHAVAKKIGSKHHVFSLTNSEMFAHLDEILDSIDEPFADSSAIAVYLLSKYTRKEVTVALSGDGADELFSGYNKHTAEFKARHPGIKEQAVKIGFPLWKFLPKSRNNALTNLNRQLFKFSQGANLTHKERYWLWASVINEEKANYLLKEELIFNPQRLSDTAFEYKKRKEDLLKPIRKEGDLNDVLYADSIMVLPNDMLRKVDMMSMANSLEVRVPFLDHKVVNFAFKLPRAFKINEDMKKKILQDAFKDELPNEVYNRPKHGFEVPLLSWFKNELRAAIEDDLLSEKFIEIQGIFNPIAIKELKQQLFSKNPNDSAATVWAIFVFNTWWRRYF